VIVVDDDPDTLDLVCETLVLRGFSVRAFERARDALEAAIEDAPDLVVTDLFMTPLGGGELARALRREPSTRAVPIIALTGTVDPEWDLLRSFDKYLIKPFDPFALADVLTALLLSSAPVAGGALARSRSSGQR
jgi:CheY-like chemotaxis protein